MSGGAKEVGPRTYRETFGRYYEDFRVGDIYEHRPGRTLTQYDNISFTLLTMNTHPLHFDEEYAKHSEFGRCIVCSPLTVALMVGMSVTDMIEVRRKTDCCGAGGIGAAALIGLIAIKMGRRRGPITNAIAAVGQRSMTFYLFQSFVFVAVFAPYAGGLGGYVSISGATVVAVMTWLLSVVIAAFMHFTNIRGPAEALLRRLTYQRK
jgi:uncharacterized membrane protein YeiB